MPADVLIALILIVGGLVVLTCVWRAHLGFWQSPPRREGQDHRCYESHEHSGH